MPRVAFVNENTLGHRSYLEPLARALEAMPGSNFQVDWHDATPLPPDLAWFGESSVRGLRRCGLDLGATRWRVAASRNALRLVRQGHARQHYDAVVANTQSVALSLAKWPGCPPLIVCLDATFRQLARSPWLAPGALGRLAAPFTLSWLLRRECDLFRKARWLVPWSNLAARSLVDEYGVEGHHVRVIPPSVPSRTGGPLVENKPEKKQLLFIGSDFKRKGGLILVEAWRRHLRDRWNLHIVTQAEVTGEPGMTVHRGIRHGSVEWERRWREADLFVFPSSLETFGIVLVEALSLGVPVISTRAGAASEILDGGRAGILLNEATPEAIAHAVSETENRPAETEQRRRQGLKLAGDGYGLGTNVGRLAEMVEECCKVFRNAGNRFGAPAN